LNGEKQGIKQGIEGFVAVAGVFCGKTRDERESRVNKNPGETNCQSSVNGPEAPPQRLVFLLSFCPLSNYFSFFYPLSSKLYFPTLNGYFFCSI